MIKEICNTMRTGYTLPKIYHMKRNEIDNFNNTETFFLVHNYINWYLTGGKHYDGCKMMERGDVSGSAWWSPLT